MPVFVYLTQSTGSRLTVATFGPAVPAGWRPPRKPSPSLAERFWARVDKNGPVMPGMETPCWEWTGYRLGGYAAIRRGGRGTKTVRATHVAWEIQRGEPFPADRNACHHCDNPGCVRVEPDGKGHVFAGTHADNMADMMAKGRSARGERSGVAKLDERAVRAIRAARQQGVTLAVLARRFGVSQNTVSVAANGKNWAHVV